MRGNSDDKYKKNQLATEKGKRSASERAYLKAEQVSYSTKAAAKNRSEHPGRENRDKLVANVFQLNQFHKLGKSKKQVDLTERSKPTTDLQMQVHIRVCSFVCACMHLGAHATHALRMHTYTHANRRMHTSMDGGTGIRREAKRCDGGRNCCDL